MTLILSTTLDKETLIKAINSYFYSTTYNINQDNQITWKDGEIKEDLVLKVSKGRYKVYATW